MPRPKNPFDTAIQVRVKRKNQTFFILVDEYDDMVVLKSNLVSAFTQIELVKQEEPLAVEDIRLCLRNRVSEQTHNLFLLSDLGEWE